jgi:16S rRNA (cytidine1402-2'-O)-methyltransferase
LPTDRFTFEGFLPAKQGERQHKLEALRNESRTLVFYEAPHRLKEALADVRRVFGDRQIVVAREVSKVHEEFLRGTLDEVLAGVADREVKGEITMVVRGAVGGAEVSEHELNEEIQRLADEGIGVKEISEVLGERYQLAKREVYKLALRHKERQKI